MKRRLFPLKKPSFLWQGLLILLPAAVLATLGFLSLRQDQILAQHEATEQAQAIARTLAEKTLPDALQLAASETELVAAVRGRLARPEDDPIARWAHAAEPVTAVLVNKSGELLYPAPLTGFPVPALLDLEALDEEPAHLWSALLASESDVEPGDCVAILDRFLKTEPPQEFKAVAIFFRGTLAEKMQDPERAGEDYRSIIEDYPTARTESGFLLHQFARLRWLSLPGAPQNATQHRAEILDGLCSAVISEPTLLTPRFLDAAIDLDEARADRWKMVWLAHERARQIYEELLALGDGELPKQTAWHTPEGEASSLIEVVSTGNNERWLLSRDWGALSQRLSALITAHSTPPYFQIAAEIAGRRLGELAPGAILATASGGRLAAIPAVSVAVHLAKPEMLFARQRARTRSFGWLIAVSAASVIAGFGTAYRAFRREQRLGEMKSNFVSSVSHELRSPIASVRLMAEELEHARLSDLPKAREYHRFIVRECRRLTLLIENVLDFARMEQGRKEYDLEPTDLGTLVDESADLMRTYGAERGIEIRVSKQGDPVALNVDSRGIQQVLVNLFDNAIKHSAPGSHIDVQLQYEVGRVLLSVADEGEGIPAEDHTRIFERFYRRGSELRRETQGVGLGLSIVKSVAEAHGGRVAVESDPGAGSRFTVTLPVQGNGWHAG